MKCCTLYPSTNMTTVVLFFLFSSRIHCGYANPLSEEKKSKTLPSIIDSRLISAIETNDLKRATELILSKQNINGQDFFGYTPLHYAAKKGNKGIVMLLIKAKALLNQKSNKSGNTPLLLAVTAGHKDIVALLLTAGADPEIKNHEGYNAVHLAINNKNIDFLPLLGQAGASYNTPTSMKISPLRLALQTGSVPIIHYLLSDPNLNESLDCNGYTELHWSVKNNKTSICKLLLESRKFNINAKTANGVTPLHFIAANQESSNRLLRLLLNSSLIEINMQDITGSTPLHYAAAANHVKAVRSLLNHASINANIQNHSGQTALHYAVEKQHVALTKKLLPYAHRSLLLQNKQGFTPLDLALHKKNIKMHKILQAYMCATGIEPSLIKSPNT